MQKPAFFQREFEIKEKTNAEPMCTLLILLFWSLLESSVVLMQRVQLILQDTGEHVANTHLVLTVTRRKHGYFVGGLPRMTQRKRSRIVEDATHPGTPDFRF